MSGRKLNGYCLVHINILCRRARETISKRDARSTCALRSFCTWNRTKCEGQCSNITLHSGAELVKWRLRKKWYKGTTSLVNSRGTEIKQPVHCYTSPLHQQTLLHSFTTISSHQKPKITTHYQYLRMKRTVQVIGKTRTVSAK